MELIPAILIAIAAFVVAAIVFFFVGINYRKKVAEAKIGLAEDQAKQIIAEGERQAESKKKEALLEAK